MDYTQVPGVSQRTRPGAMTPQSEPIPGSTQVPNNAGGFGWDVGVWERFNRFLMLGAEGNTFYVGRDELVKESAASVEACIKQDGDRTVRRIVEVSTQGLAPKNDPSLFALAMAAGIGDDATRKLALEVLPLVARTGTHLMHFAQYVTAFRGWGRGLRGAVANWFEFRPAKDLAYQLVKYQGRDGWTMADLLRLSHPKAEEGSDHALLYRFAATGFDDVQQKSKIKMGARKLLQESESETGAFLIAFDKVRQSMNPVEVAAHIRTFRLPREAIPTPFLKERVVWEALAEQMPMHALVRNLGVMTANGLIGPGSEWTRRFSEQLHDGEKVVRSRLHPIAILSAAKVYASGSGVRGSLRWSPEPAIIDALNDAFYLAFPSVPRHGKRTLIGLDHSGSMHQAVVGIEHLTAMEAACAMGLVHAATESEAVIVEFGTSIRRSGISGRQRLDDVIRNAVGMGGTDCSLPVQFARLERLEVDAFILYTDNETWAGQGHPQEHLNTYRAQVNRNAKLVCVSMAANRTSVVEPDDSLSLGIAGLDASVPALVAGFIQG